MNLKVIPVILNGSMKSNPRLWKRLLYTTTHTNNAKVIRDALKDYLYVNQ